MDILFLLFKMNVSLLVFYSVYRLVLRKLTFFNFNRIYLIGAIIVSLAFPFLKYSDTASAKIDAIQQSIGINSILAVEQTSLSWTDYALAIYWGGVIIMSVIFITQLTSLIVLFFRTRPNMVMNQKVRSSNQPLSPFSFFKSIFLNPTEHTNQELISIIQHEQVHVKQWHSLDIILGEVKRIFCWFNPIAWLLLNAIRENLEFIADRKVLQNGVNPKQYQYTLLSVQQNNNMSISNHFNLSKLKLRITMMNKKKSNDFHLVKYLLAVPAIAATLLSVNFVNAQEQQQEILLNEAKVEVIKLPQGTDINIDDLLNKLAVELFEKNIIQFHDIAQLSTDSSAKQTIKPSENAVVTVSKANIHDTIEVIVPENNSNFMVVSSSAKMILDPHEIGTIDKIKVISGDPLHFTIAKGSNLDGPSTYRVVFDKDNDVQKTPSAVQGRIIKIPINGTDTSLTKIENISIGYTTMIAGKNLDTLSNSTNKQNFRIKDMKSVENIHVFIDGVLNKEGLNSIDPKSIKELNILKNKEDVKKYVPNAGANDGVILITTKSTNIEKQDEDHFSFDVSPNPTNSSWFIQLNNHNTKATYEVYDMNGRKIISGDFSGSTAVNCTNYASGTYIIKLKVGNKEYNKKVQKRD